MHTFSLKPLLIFISQHLIRCHRSIHFIVYYTEYFAAVSLTFNFDFIALLFFYIFVSIRFSVVLFCILFLNHHKFHVWFYVYANYVLVLLEHLNTTKYYPNSWYLQYNPSQIIKWSMRKHKKHTKSQHDRMFCRPLFSHTNSFSATFTTGQIKIFSSIISSQNLHMSSGLWNVNLIGSRILFHSRPVLRSTTSHIAKQPLPVPLPLCPERQAGPLWQRTVVCWPQPTLLHVYSLKNAIFNWVLWKRQKERYLSDQ